MANVQRFAKNADYAAKYSGSGDWNFHKKVLHDGVQSFRTVGDIGLIFAHWVTDRENLRKPIYCKGPDPSAELYMDEKGVATGEPVCPLCAVVARMKLSPDPAVKALTEGDEGLQANPCYTMNVLDLDNPKVNDDLKHCVLLVNNEKSNFFGVGIANQIRQCLVNYGSEDRLADYETYNGTGLVFKVARKGQKKQIRYRVDAIPAPRALSAEELAYGRYEIDDISTATPMAKVKEWLGESFCKTYGLTDAVLADKDRWIAQRGGEGDKAKDDGQGGAAPSSAPPSRGAADPRAPLATTAPSGPPPGAAAPSGPPPGAVPTAPPPVMGPDGKPLPPGWTWKMNEQYATPMYFPPGGGTPVWERPH